MEKTKMKRMLLRSLAGVTSVLLIGAGVLTGPAQSAPVTVTAKISVEGQFNGGLARLVSYEYLPTFARWQETDSTITDNTGTATLTVESGEDYRFCFEPNDNRHQAPCFGGVDILSAQTVTPSGAVDLGTVDLVAKTMLDMSSVRIKGHPVVGQTLSLDTNGLPGDLLGMMVAWLRDGSVDAATGQSMGGVLGESYTYRVRSEDLGHMIAVEVEGYTRTAVSSFAFLYPLFRANVTPQVGPVVLPKGFSGLPGIKAARWKRGRVASYVAPADTPAGAVATFQWLRAGKPIPGATNSSRKITRKDRRKRLSLSVTYVQSGHETTILETVRSPRIR